MNLNPKKCIQLFARLALGLMPLISLSLFAAPADTGSINGRIQNGDSGNYLYGAQILVLAPESIGST